MNAYTSDVLRVVLMDMRLASLFTGGKDSTYATRLAEECGDEVELLVTMYPRRMDSWMFHTVNIDLAPIVAEAFGIENIVAETSGEKEKELDDLRSALDGLDVEGLVTGAIASTYQRRRVDRICEELGLIHITPLWGKDGFDLLMEMILSGLVIIITAVAAQGLDETWLGRVLEKEVAEELSNLNERFGVNVCGEGGEMETLVLDAPWFSKRLRIEKAKPIWDGVRGSYIVEEVRLQNKKGA
jgi:ABC transporter with metal-binding/Fe-S-binding domain ATP-binding protein